MSERERLIEIMAEGNFDAEASVLDAVCRWRHLTDRERRHRISYMRAAVEAAEAAGFTIVPPDDGR